MVNSIFRYLNHFLSTKIRILLYLTLVVALCMINIHGSPLDIDRSLIIIVAVVLGFLLYDLDPVWPFLAANAAFFLLYFEYRFMYLSVFHILQNIIVLNAVVLSLLSIHKQRIIIQNQMITTDAVKMEFILSFVRAMDARDDYTANHSYRVALYSLHLGKLMGFSKKDLENLWLGGLIHDIGKMGLPESLLLKEGKLTNEEYEALKQHTVIGYGIVASLPILDDVKVIVRSHHERIDGKGYPDGLVGDRIPSVARIACIADSFDAMTTDRSYRTARSFSTARVELIRCGGVQFDERMVSVWAEFVSSFHSVEHLVNFLEAEYNDLLHLNKKNVIKHSKEAAASLDISRDVAQQMNHKSFIWESLVEDSPDAIIVFDKSQCVIAINQVFETLLQWKRDEVIGMKLDQFSSITQRSFSDMRKEIYKGKIIVRNVVGLQKKSGEPFISSITAFPIRVHTGEIVAIAYSFQDVTERIKMQEREKNIRERLEAFLFYLPVAISVYDLEGYVVDVNPAFTRLYGWGKEELKGRKPVQIPDSCWAEWESDLERLKQREVIIEKETTRVNKNGVRIKVSITLFPIFNDKKEVTQVASITFSSLNFRRSQVTDSP